MESTPDSDIILENAKKIIQTLENYQIPKLTLFAFSSENNHRSKVETNYIFNLFLEYLINEFKTLQEKNVKFKVVGNINIFPKKLAQKILYTQEKLVHNTGLSLNIAAGYGGRWDIVQSTKLIAKKVIDNELKIEQIDEELFNSHLTTDNNGDVDLLIRTGGEYRISNFLLWDLAYSELYFSDKFWPDFGENELTEAINFFNGRTRRFGKK